MNDNPLDNFLANRAKIAAEWQEIIEKMLGSYSSYHYAENTLLGILDYIHKNDHITEAQIRAVENIKEKPSERYG